MKIGTTSQDTLSSVKCLIYGLPGVGKTTLAGTVDSALIISAEAGLIPLRDKSIDVIDISIGDDGSLIPRPMRAQKVMEAYKFLLTDEARKRYKWVFIDSITEIAQNISEQCNQEFPDRKDSLVLWGEYNKRMRGLVKAFRDLPGYNVVVIALEVEDKDDIGRRFPAIDVPGKISQQMPQFFDIVMRAVSVQKEDKIARALLTQGGDKFIAKDRTGKLSAQEPMNFSTIFKKINGEST